MFYNRDSDLISGNDAFYRKTLKLETDEFVWREPPTQPHQDVLLEGNEMQHYSIFCMLYMYKCIIL